MSDKIPYDPELMQRIAKVYALQRLTPEQRAQRQKLVRMLDCAERGEPLSPPPINDLSIDERMMLVFLNDRECVGWSLQKWSAYLNCSRESPRQTNTWKAILEERERLKQSRPN